jgi:hypothetical protein
VGVQKELLLQHPGKETMTRDNLIQHGLLMLVGVLLGAWISDTRRWVFLIGAFVLVMIVYSPPLRRWYGADDSGKRSAVGVSRGRVSKHGFSPSRMPPHQTN